MLRRVFTVASIILSISWLAVPASAEPKRIVVAQAIQSLLYLPLYVGIKKGIFLKHGLDVVKETAPRPAAAIDAVVSGKAQFSLQAAAWAAVAAQKGAPVWLVANCVAGAGVWVVGAQDMPVDPAEWKGQTVVLGKMPSSNGTLFMNYAREKGLDPKKDLKTVEVQLGYEFATLLTLGDYAKLAVTNEPGTAWALNSGMKVLVSFPKLYPNFVASAITARKDADPETVQAFVNGLQDALKLMAADRQVAIEVALEEFPALAPQIVTAAAERMLEEKLFASSVEITQESLDRGLELYVTLGQLKALPNFDEFVGAEYFRRAISRG